MKHAAAEGAASQIAASDVGFEGTRLPHPREGGREGRREQGEIAPKNTLERGVGEEESLAKDLQKSLGEEKPKAGSHSKCLRCVCGEWVADSAWKRRHAVSRPARFGSSISSGQNRKMPRRPRR